MIEQEMSQHNNANATQMATIAMNADKRQTQPLKPETKAAIRRQMHALFFGLTMTNWLRGKTLGAAWHDAIQQMASFLASKPANNPAVAYLCTEFARHRAAVARSSMTHPNRDLKLDLDPEMAKTLSAAATKATNTSLDKLKSTFAEHAPVQTSAKNPYAESIKRVQMLQLQQQQQMMAMQSQYGAR